MASFAVQRLPLGVRQLRSNACGVPRVLQRAALASKDNSQASDKLQKRDRDGVTANSFWGPLVPSIFSSGREGMLFRTIEEDLKDLRAFWNDSFPSDHQATSGFGAADIQELDRAITIKLDLPGMQKENLKVTVDRDQVLTITGRRETSANTEEPSGFQRHERSVGTFRRQFQLPASADTSAIKAKAENGVLHVEISKLESVAPDNMQVAVD